MNDYLFDPSPRLPNGVKIRRDGRGDAWAAQHRAELGNEFLMQDVDAAFGAVVFGQNSGERLFLEYVPDNYVNRRKLKRDFAIVAMFDRKATRETAFDNHAVVSKAFYLWQCRMFAEYQSIAPKFFICVGKQEPPWVMVELDIYSGEPTGVEASVSVGDWRTVWEALGLADLRKELKRWLVA